MIDVPVTVSKAGAELQGFGDTGQAAFWAAIFRPPSAVGAPLMAH
jgi:hypothetical protein